ncbi:MAG: alpha-galactosidase [Oscillospiraceae bacterium]|nr:alpha-galactosidase [Oscillospiraceae bacterium]
MDILRAPDFVTLISENPNTDACVHFETGDCLRILLTAKEERVKFIRLRWHLPMPPDALLLGDAWERGYGDLCWRGYDPDRPMPWYFLLTDRKGAVSAAGVKVRPRALCCWNADEDGVTLLLDVRNGGSGVMLGGRTLEAAQVVSKDYCGVSEFDAACDFCSVMSPEPILPKHPVYGGNNWYYAYGRSSHEEIVTDASYMAELSEGLQNRPYMVIDDGWSVNHTQGPWDRGGETFPDMARLAKEISALGVHPGIWVRFLCDKSKTIPDAWYLRKEQGQLDPSHPEVLCRVAEDTERLVGWGYELIKHDFTSFDIFGRYGFAFSHITSSDGWSFHDRTKTTAEIILQLYQTILDHAGDALILGCNCIGHLCAGLAHMNRIGDDTSGREWERTRKMGINTLAFRLCQHKRFFDVDADCVGITEQVPWELNRKWLSLLANSGTSLFVSSKKGLLTGSALAELKAAFAVNALQKDTLVPLDWLSTTTPRQYLCNGKLRSYSWSDPAGISHYVMPLKSDV